MLILVVVVFVCHGVVAKYVNSSQRLENSFSRDAYDTPTAKANLSVEVGKHTYPVYVRVSIVANWVDSNNKVYCQVPTVSFNYDTENWTLYKDGYYYYNKAVASGNETLALLLTDITTSTSPPTGYTLHLEVLTETIQAVGITDDGKSTAVMDAWKVQPQNKEGVDDVQN